MIYGDEENVEICTYSTQYFEINDIDNHKSLHEGTHLYFPHGGSQKDFTFSF